MYCYNKCFLLLCHYNFHRKITTLNCSNIPSGTYMVYGKTVKCPADVQMCSLVLGRVIAKQWGGGLNT